VGKLSLPGLLLRLRGLNHLTTDTVRYEIGGHPFAPLHPCAPPTILSLPPSLCLDKKKRGGEKRERAKEKKEEIPGS
jgi:hypothetical protein